MLKKCCACVLALSLLFLSSVSALAVEQVGVNDSYTIDVPYDYPVKPGSPEWASFTTHQQMIDACEIPAEILEHMTTAALVETVLSYPLLGDMFAWTSQEDGYRVICSRFNGAKELAERSDAYEVLLDYKISLHTAPKMNSVQNSYLDVLRPIYLDTVISVTAFDDAALDSEFSTNQSRATSVTLYTPSNSPVPAYYNLTYSDHGTTEAAVAASEAYYMQTYPLATEISTYNPSYNCHSYAWHSTATTNKYWINDPTPYVDDPFYRINRFDPKVEDKVTYHQKWFEDGWPKSGIVHSAIVYSTSGDSVTVRSKWGMLGVFQHDAEYSPYSDTGTILSYHSARS